MTTVTALVDQADYAATLAALAEANQWRARYMAAHEVMLAVEAFVEAVDRPSVHVTDPALLMAAGYRSSGDKPGLYAVDWQTFRAMRAAFLAYRAAIEAGAPLGWAVAEEPADVL